MSDANGNHGARIARLETAVATIAETQAHQSKQLDAIATKIDGVGRWNVGQVSAIIGACVILVAAFGSPYLDRQDDLRAGQKELIKSSQEVSKTRWSRTDAERSIDRFEKDLDDLEDYVDMRDERVLDIAQKQIDDIEADLASRRGRRWNRDDHDLYVKPRLDSLEALLNDVRVQVAERKQVVEKVSAAEAEILRLRDQVGELREELARRSAAIDFVEEEQARRRPLSYGTPENQ